jgi:hypothetical protein
MGTAAKPTRQNRTITIDFRNESTYFCLLKDGKAFVECVIAFIMSLGFQLTHKVTCKGGRVSDTSLALCACPAGRGHHLASPVHHVQSGIHRAPSRRFALALSAPGGGPRCAVSDAWRTEFGALCRALS